jgi:capsular polysaccharide transport system permease protein
LTEQHRRIVTKGMWRGAAPSRLPGLSVDAIARGAQVALRRVSGVVALRRSLPAEADSESPPRAALPLPNPYLASFVAVVIVPALVCAVYLAFLASDQYVAEARFAVQSAQFGLGNGDVGKNGLASLSAGAIPVMAGPDAYVITNYIHSRAILDDLSGKVDVQAIFRRPEADFWARLKDKASPEELTDYWDKMVSTYIDGPSGIVTLTVRAFRPADAQSLAQAVIAASETLANKVSERARATIMGQAEGEVRRSEGLVSRSLADMRQFRDQQGFIDPVSAATSTSTLLMQAMTRKITVENNYFVASKSMSPQAPTVVELKNQLDALDGQIDKLKGELTGNSPQGRTISAALVTFEQLELKRTFAEKLYTMAQEALERARMRAEEQNIFISTFVPPDVPQEAKYPQRLALSLLIPIGLAIVWGIFAFIGAAIEDHKY